MIFEDVVITTGIGDILAKVQPAAIRADNRNSDFILHYFYFTIDYISLKPKGQIPEKGCAPVEETKSHKFYRLDM